MKLINESSAWQALLSHQKAIVPQQMQTWFATEPHRFENFSLNLDPIFLDYSKNRITKETLSLLFQLAKQAKLDQKIEALFSGAVVNTTEKQPALHTALRAPKNKSIYVNEKDIILHVHTTLEKMRELIERVHQQTWLGSTGKPIRNIVNIGIGGSYLGARMATHALSDFAHPNLRCFFISNIDHAHIDEVLNQIDPETTLFIISSKSFSTLETITNANTIKHWLEQKLQTSHLGAHFIAVTTATQKAIEFGVLPEHILPIWDWVGGRYSVWSAVGLPLAMMIGMDHFLAFLKGAHEMDEHFRHAPFEKNMPVIMAMLGIWYINFFDAINHAVIPYTHQLNHFQDHLQQLDMESNGKQTTLLGETAPFATGPILWGEQGCNGQHAFHQLLHQGQYLVPVDFILVGKGKNALNSHQDILVASGLSQSQALMRGKTHEEAVLELQTAGYTADDASLLAIHKMIPGNRPSNTLFLDEINPYNLGFLLALYEHKIFVQGAIWDINSFDQWGVELGKQLLPVILKELQNETLNPLLDASTQGLIKHYKKLKEKKC